MLHALTCRSSALTIALLLITALASAQPGPRIESSDLLVTFRGQAEGYDISSIRHRSGGTAFMRFRMDPDYGKLFEIELRANEGRGEPLEPHNVPEGYQYPPTISAIVDNHSACRAADASREPARDGTTLRLRWRGIAVADEPDALDVTVTVSTRDGRPGLDWRIEVANRSARWGVWMVRFPIIRAQPIGDSGDNDSLVWPKGAGRVIPNPFSEASGTAYRFINLHLEYPGPQQNMQFGALYDDQLGGLYWGAHDPRAERKLFAYHAREDGVWFRLEHLPPGMGRPGVGYSMSYPLHLQYTPGHWWDAAQIYRDWALRQVWCSRGPTASRRDVPQWYREAPIVFVTYSSRENTIEQMHEYSRMMREQFSYDGPLPLIWYNWNHFDAEATAIDSEDAVVHAGDMFPAKTGFAGAVADLEQHGVYVQPYFDVRVFDFPGDPPAIPAEVLPWTVKDVNGVPRPWTAAWPGLVDICYGTPFMRNYVADGVRRLAAECGARGAYLDQFAGLQHACFDSDHPHPAGAGYQTAAIRRIGVAARTAARAVQPDAIFSGENGGDCFIDVLDGNLLHYDIFPGLTPVLAAVYGDYWMQYGRGLASSIGRPQEFRLILGNIFTYGIKLGRLGTNPAPALLENYSNELALIDRCARFRVAALQYLGYGRLLRPLEFANDLPVIRHLHPTFPEEYGSYVYQPAIMSSVWEAPDGSMGIVLFNISGESQTCTFSLTRDSYPGLPHRSLVYAISADDEETLLRRDVRAPVKFDTELEPDEIEVLVVRAQR